jgi:large subunit ribosomal protein L17
MRHQVRGRKLNRTKSHRDAMFCNMATSLFEHKKLHTTEAKAKELRPFAESLITKAKNALSREKQNLLPEGQTVDIHNRRLVGRFIRNKGVLQELFDAIAPAVEARNGGYTRITKTGIRRGDAGRTAMIELVDWSAPLDGAVSLKRKKKKAGAKKTATTVKPEAKKVGTVNEEATVETVETVEVEETTEEVVETVEATVENTDESTAEETDAPSETPIDETEKTT